MKKRNHSEQHKAIRQQRHAAIRAKKLYLQKKKATTIGIATFQLSRWLHEYMRELSRRKRLESKMFIEDHYRKALKEYLRDLENPKRILKRQRMAVRIQCKTTDLDLIDHASRIAYKEERPLARIIEEAVKQYIDKPENYLGKTYKEENPNEYEFLDEGTTI
jgi:hypothetical protein